MTDRPPTADDPWLTSMLPFVRSQLPEPPAHIVEIGCGSLGGFAPALAAAGYDAIGVDPEAPDGPLFRTVTFEEYADDQPADAVVASLSLHHVGDVSEVLDLVAGRLAPAGLVVVLEWASERFDEATAQWCFARLSAKTGSGEPGHGHPEDHGHPDDPGAHEHLAWLHHLAEGWRESGQTWDAYFRAWTKEAGLHPGHVVLDALQQRFDTLELREGPYFFTDLDATRDDEAAAIQAGQIRPACLQFVGRLR